MKLPALGLRGKLGAAALVLAALPWVGWLYVEELERFLMEAQAQVLMGTARAVATALHDRPWLLGAPAADSDTHRQAEEELRQLTEERGVPAESAAAPPAAPADSGREVKAILRGIERTTSRLWVVNREFRVLALAGSLKRSETGAPEPEFLERVAHVLFSGLVQGPSEDFDEASPQDALASNPEIAAAFQGAPRSAARHSPDRKAVIVSAAHPIWAGNEVVGAVIAEETTNSVLSVRSRALERLLLATLAAFVLAAAALGTIATRISVRILRLRDEAEGAIDAQGRIAREISVSRDGDEIGDLSRSFSALLGRLAAHHAYLETMASRLSHELRTPVAVVRSSLENLKLGGSPEETRVYLARAEEGLARLSTILTRMSEAARLEQGLATTQRERFELREVLRGCIAGYRLAFSERMFELEVPAGDDDRAVTVEGSPDLIAQLLDKLVDNANDFAAPGTPVRVRLEALDDAAVLSVTNLGLPLPEGMRERLFASMVSIRSGSGTRGPHLGLGLHIARLITEFHRGSIRAEDLPEGGVRIVVTLPLAPSALPPAPA
jgi:two-component system sensor histidine kinase ChvG